MDLDGAKMRASFKLSLAATFFVLGAFVGLSSFEDYTATTRDASKFSSIVRLVTDTGKTYCSGVVVAKDKAITAMHCVKPELIVKIRTADNKHRGVEVQVTDLHPSLDRAVLSGDFKDFDVSPFYHDVEEVANARYDSLTTCGFPLGGDLYCSKFAFRKLYGFFWGGKAVILPGMSGGPVFDASGRVVAINYGVDMDDGLVSPMYNVYMMGVGEEH